MTPAVIFELAAVNDAKAHGELKRYPADKLVLVSKQRFEGQLADDVQRVKCELYEPLDAIRARRVAAPVMKQGDHKPPLGMPRNNRTAVSFRVVRHGFGSSQN